MDGGGCGPSCRLQRLPIQGEPLSVLQAPAVERQRDIAAKRQHPFAAAVALVWNRLAPVHVRGADEEGL